MLNWVENKLLAKGLKYWAHSLLDYKLSWENNQPENMCNNVFEKPSEGFFKKGVMRNFA